jgi:hypothetical protein
MQTIDRSNHELRVVGFAAINVFSETGDGGQPISKNVREYVLNQVGVEGRGMRGEGWRAAGPRRQGGGGGEASRKLVPGAASPSDACRKLAAFMAAGGAGAKDAARSLEPLIGPAGGPADEGWPSNTAPRSRAHARPAPQHARTRRITSLSLPPRRCLCRGSCSALQPITCCRASVCLLLTRPAPPLPRAPPAACRAPSRCRCTAASFPRARPAAQRCWRASAACHVPPCWCAS